MVNYQEFKTSIRQLQTYDMFMNRLGHLKSAKYSKANEQLQADLRLAQTQEDLAIEKTRENIGADNCYWPLINQTEITNIHQLDDEELEDWWPAAIPESAQNSVVVNLFCIDDNYETRA